MDAIKQPTLLISALALIFAGALQTLAIGPFDWWLLGPLSIYLILWGTGALDTQSTITARPILFGWLFGLGLFGSGASWVYVSIHTYGYASPPLATFLTALFVMGLALFQAFQFWLFYKCRTHSIALNALLFIAIWVLSDAFRTDFLTGFPWLFLGYGHLNSPLAGWIPVIGVYGITAIVVATGTLAYLLSRIPKQPLIRASVMFTAILWLSGMPLTQVNWTDVQEQEASTALLQINIPQELKWKREQRGKTLKLLRDQTEAHWDKDIIIWPEMAVPMMKDQAQGFLNLMNKKAKENDANLITGIGYRDFIPEENRFILHNSIFSFGVGEGINHKQKLVPFGEYVPLEQWLRGLIQFFDLPMSDFRTGPSEQDLLQTKSWKTAPFICYEVVYPDFVARRATGADYLLTISNDAWFGSSIGPLQHLQMAQYRAAENGRYMVRGTNNGISAIIDEKGQLLEESPQFERYVLTGNIKMFSGNTPYSMITSTPLFILCGAILLFFLLQRKRFQAEDPTED